MRLLIALVMALSVAHAADIPQSSTRDNRIQYVNYHSGDVVVVHTSVGFVSRIVFEADEIVQSPVHIGMPDGWDITANGRILTIKPLSVAVDQDTVISPNPKEWNTNLAVETNKRLYDFDVRLLADGYTGKEFQAFYRVEFRYPIEREQQARTAAKQQSVDVVSKRKAAVLPKPENMNYAMRLGENSEDIAPTMAYDDGIFTYLKFPNNRDIPAVFIETSDGLEGRVNTNMHESERNLLVIQRVSRKFILRLGRSVVVVSNERFDIDGSPPVNGTTVDGLIRSDR